MKIKQYEASFKALESEGGQPGAFEAVVAVFDNVDRVGDRLKSTAFDATLKAWQESGDPIPVILSHQWDDAMAIIGHADPRDCKAIPGRGLYVKGQIHLDTDNPVAKQVYQLMQKRLIREFSFGYTIAPGGEKKASDGAFDLSAVNLIEFGPCLKGVNPSTELLAVKAAVAGEAESRKKSYVDVAVEGSFEEIQNDLMDALQSVYFQDNDIYVSVKLVATTVTDVVYQVSTGGESTMYRASYAENDQGKMELGEAVEVEFAVVPSSEKSDKDIKAKAYMEVEGLLDGSYEAIEDDLNEVLSAAYPAPDTPNSSSWVSVLDYNGTEVVYRVCTNGPDGQEEQTYRATYTTDDNGDVTLGEPTAVEIQSTVVDDTKSEEPTPEAEPEVKAEEVIEPTDAELETKAMEGVELDIVLANAAIESAEYAVGAEGYDSEALEALELERTLAAAEAEHPEPEVEVKSAALDSAYLAAIEGLEAVIGPDTSDADSTARTDAELARQLRDLGA